MSQCWLEGNGRKYPLSQHHMFVIGRSPNCNLVINHMSISKEHAVINYDTKQNQYVLKDLQSVNGCLVNDIKHKNKILLDADIIIFGKDYKNQFKFTSSPTNQKPNQLEQNHSYLELDRKIQVLDLNSLHQIQNDQKYKVDQQSNNCNSQQHWNQKSIERMEQQKIQENQLEEQLLEKEEILVQKEEEIKAIKNENELMRDEKMVLQQQLQAIKQYMADLQIRLQQMEDEKRMYDQKTPDSEKQLIENRREISQLRLHLNQNRLEVEFYQKQLNKIGEGEKYGKIIEQLQKEVIQCSKIKEQYENRENECSRQWGQLIQENHNKQQKINMFKGQIEQIQRDQQMFYQQCEEKMQRVNNKLLEILDNDDIQRQQYMAGQLLVNEMGNMQDENMYLNEQNMKNNGIINELNIQISQQQKEIEKQQQQRDLREKVEELSDLVYELRTSSGVDKVQQLERDNRRLEERLGIQEQEIKEMREKIRKKEDKNGNEYGEDMVEYFGRLVNQKDKKIGKLIEQVREEKKEQKQMGERIQTLSEQLDYIKHDRQKQQQQKQFNSMRGNVDYRNKFGLNMDVDMDVDVDIPESILQQFKG